MARRKQVPEPARPAPFTAEQVAALSAGQADSREIGRILAAHRQSRLPEPARGKRAKAAPAPVPLTAADVRELATGRTPASVERELEARATSRRTRAAGRRTTGAKPTRRPG